jgi:hypothetical protein
MRSCDHILESNFFISADLILGPINKLHSIEIKKKYERRTRVFLFILEKNTLILSTASCTCIQFHLKFLFPGLNLLVFLALVAL